VDWEYSGIGSQIHIWNICDTSKLRVSNVLLNGNDPETECVNNTWHGPIGRWRNGAACDYYGKYGLYAENQFSSNTYYNYGVFRLMTGGRGLLKTLYDVGYNYVWMVGEENDYQASAGGSAADQLTAQGYQAETDIAKTLSASDPITESCRVPEDNIIFWQQTHLGHGWGQETASGYEMQFGKGLAGVAYQPGRVNGMWTHAPMSEGGGMLWDYGQLHPQFALPPIHAKWENYLDLYIDESAVNLFANSKHGANKKIGLCSIYKSYTPFDSGGEGRDGTTVDADYQNSDNWITFGLGVRSLNIFDLAQLV